MHLRMPADWEKLLDLVVEAVWHLKKPTTVLLIQIYLLNHKAVKVEYLNVVHAVNILQERGKVVVSSRNDTSHIIIELRKNDGTL